MTKYSRLKQRRLLKGGCALVLFSALLIIYWISVPNAFNTVRENRRFFDSDGEFITRQFRQGKTYTHRDHLLYHILGTLLYQSADSITTLSRDPVIVHKILSVFFGAAGITLLFLIGLKLNGQIVPSLLAALFVAGSAGYWFFSATIDTYIPALCCSILTLGAALLALREDKTMYYIVWGSAMGLAFLFRTDGVLLASSGAAFFGSRKPIWRKLLLVILFGAIVAIGGYMVFAHHFYNVPFKDIPAWSTGYGERQEAGSDWGILANVTWKNLQLGLVNQQFYTILLPGLESTRDSRIYKMMAELRYGTPALMIYLTFLILLLGSVLFRVVTYLKHQQWAKTIPVVLAVLWFFSRTLFYTWWNPYEPFLFAVMSIPALWLLCLFVLQDDTKNTYLYYARLLGILLITTLVWLHNLLHFMLPLRALPI